MYEVMHRVAKVSCDYVRDGWWSPDARIMDWLAYRQTIREVYRELRRVAEDLDRAVNVGALRQIKETGKLSFSHFLDRSFSTVPCRAANFA